jgi:hypothetical protein
LNTKAKKRLLRISGGWAEGNAADYSDQFLPKNSLPGKQKSFDEFALATKHETIKSLKPFPLGHLWLLALSHPARQMLEQQLG